MTLPAGKEPEAPTPDPAESGWRRTRVTPSLAEVYRTIPVAHAHWFRKILAFAGPGYLVAVGYMDPGNWATDLAGGSQFGYTLLAVILLSNLMAILPRALSARHGLATGPHPPPASRAAYPSPVRRRLWIAGAAGLAACDP